MEYLNIPAEALAGFDQLRIALADDNLWMQRGSLQLMERAGMPLKVNGDRYAELDYVALLDRQLQTEEDPAVALQAVEMPSREILAAMRTQEFELGIVLPKRERSFSESIERLGVVELPSGVQGALITPKGLVRGTPAYIYTALAAARLFMASDAVLAERRIAPAAESSALRGAPVKRYL